MEQFPVSDRINEEEEDEDNEENADEEPSNNNEESFHEIELRNATSKYLKGELSLPEYAAALDEFNQIHLKSQEEELSSTVGLDSRDDDEPAANKSETNLSSLKLFEKEYVDQEGNIVRTESTDITDSLFTYVPKDGEGSDSGSATGSSSTLKSDQNFGFYRSGSDAKSFTVRRKRKLAPTIQNMIGQSHLSYAKGDWETAITICMEIIKEQPTCIEPFHTLSMIYENQGRMDKSLQYALVAGLLDPKHCEEWPKLAEMSLAENELHQAVMCYSQAILNDPGNYEYQFKRCEVYERINDFKAALKGYFKILQTFSGEGKLCVEVLRKSAGIHHDAENLDSAFQSLEIAFKKYADYITTEEINLMLELCIAQKKYVDAFKILTKHCSVKFVPEILPEQLRERESLMIALRNPEIQCVKPRPFNVDLTAKLVIVLVHLEAFHISDQLVKTIFDHNVDEFGDIYFDVAEAYMAKQNFSFALNLLTPLVRSENYSMAAVWLRYAESLFLLSRLEEAAKAYEKVVSLAPTHNLAKLNLSIILQRLGRSDAALQTLETERTEDQIDAQLLMERCHILYDNGRIGEFIEKTLHLFSRHFPHITSIEDCQIIVLISNRCKKYEALKLDRRLRGLSVPPDSHPNFLSKETDISSEWKLYLKLCQTLMNLERYDLLARVTHCAMASKLFGEYARTEREAEIHSYFSLILSFDSQGILPNSIRQFMPSFAKNNVMLNLFCLALRRSNPKRYGRHLIRLLRKYPDHEHLLMLRAHISFATFSYKNAISEYSKVHRQAPRNPLVLLMMASVYLHLMIQKANPFNRSRITMIIVALMLKYAELRGKCQESFYNVGRMFHVLGFFNLAIQNYKKVLTTAPVVHELKFHEPQFSTNGKPIGNFFIANDNRSIFDLRSEAAYNLAQIYLRSGQEKIARMYLANHIII